MPARTPIIASAAAEKLIALGKRIRAHRKARRISATTAAEAAGMSRVTLHRIEKGEPSVTMGAYTHRYCWCAWRTLRFRREGWLAARGWA